MTRDSIRIPLTYSAPVRQANGVAAEIHHDVRPRQHRLFRQAQKPAGDARRAMEDVRAVILPLWCVRTHKHRTLPNRGKTFPSQFGIGNTPASLSALKKNGYSDAVVEIFRFLSARAKVGDRDGLQGVPHHGRGH
jgi:hypothetical protein